MGSLVRLNYSQTGPSTTRIVTVAQHRKQNVNAAPRKPVVLLKTPLVLGF